MYLSSSLISIYMLRDSICCSIIQFDRERYANFVSSQKIRGYISAIKISTLVKELPAIFLVETLWESTRVYGRQEARKLHDDGYISLARLKDTILPVV
jgi:hypothetical protein